MKGFYDTQFLAIRYYSKHPEVYKMADQIADSYVSTKKRAHRDKYVHAARKLIASLWFHPSDWFRFSTKRSHYGAERKQVWLNPQVLTIFNHMRAMRPEWFQLVVKAIPPALSKTGRGMAAVYCRSYHFRKTLSMLRAEDIILDPEEERITLKNDDDCYIPIPREVKDQGWFQSTISTLEKHSEVLSRASIRLSDGTNMSMNDMTYFRRFKGSMSATGRLYAPFENWKERDRLSINFNGIPAMSIDVSSLNPILLLRMAHRLDSEPEGLFTTVENPYHIPFWEHIPRAVHKHVINMLFNCKTEATMIKACNSTHWWIDDVGEIQSETYNDKKTRQGQPVFPGKSEEIKRYIEDFKHWHWCLKNFIGTGIGNKLQFVDSELILFVLNATNQENIPVLPVHDEVVFPAVNKDFMLIALIAAFWHVLGEAGEFGTLKVKAKRLVCGEIEEEVIELDLNRRRR
ncbi:MAG: hypothetical protein O3C12_07635 [Proteobacteria bacterium]|nr:hypothetical protein [Pseudomonadota bacterium]